MKEDLTTDRLHGEKKKKKRLPHKAWYSLFLSISNIPNFSESRVLGKCAMHYMKICSQLLKPVYSICLFLSYIKYSFIDIRLMKNLNTILILPDMNRRN